MVFTKKLFFDRSYPLNSTIAHVLVGSFLATHVVAETLKKMLITKLSL